jgi:hypothetical protein
MNAGDSTLSDGNLIQAAHLGRRVKRMPSIVAAEK